MDDSAKLISELERVALGPEASRSKREAESWYERIFAHSVRSHVGEVREFVERSYDDWLKEPQGRSLAVRNIRRGVAMRDVASQLLAILESAKNRISIDASYDLAIVCALHSPELSAVRRIGGQPWQEFRTRADPTTYFQSQIQVERGQPISVVAAAPVEMGMSASGVLATKMILRFRPRLVAMVGIAAGVKRGKQSFGDVLAAEHTLDYGSGKLSPGKFEYDPKPINVDPRILDRLKAWSAQKEPMSGVKEHWNGRPSSPTIKVHVGPLGSGAAVLADPKPLKALQAIWRKLVGVEMEAHAVHLACRDATHPRVPFVCLKSVCDFVRNKGDDWQEYAAFTAARALERFVVHEWSGLGL